MIFGVAVLIWLVASHLAEGGAMRITPDSHAYLRRARAFGDGDLLWHTVTGRPPTHYPPLYPALLYLFDLLGGMGVTTWAACLHVACGFALAVGLLRLVVVLGSTEPEDRVRRHLMTAAAAACMFGPNVVNATVMVLTEMVYFTAWIWAVVWVLEQRPHRSLRGLVLLGLVGSLALLDRYVAMSMVVGLAVCLVMTGGPLRRSVPRAVAFLLIAALPLAVWSTALGGIEQSRRTSDLTAAEAGWDSVVSMGAEAVHHKTMRVGGVGGRTAVRYPAESNDGLTTAAGVIGTVIALGAAVTVGQRAFARRGWGSDPFLVLAVSTFIGVIVPLTFRIRQGHVYLDRYWGLAPTFLLLIAMGRPRQSRIEKLLWGGLVAIAVTVPLGRL